MKLYLGKDALRNSLGHLNDADMFFSDKRPGACGLFHRHSLKNETAYNGYEEITPAYVFAKRPK